MLLSAGVAPVVPHIEAKCGVPGARRRQPAEPFGDYYESLPLCASVKHLQVASIFEHGFRVCRCFMHVEGCQQAAAVAFSLGPMGLPLSLGSSFAKRPQSCFVAFGECKCRSLSH